MRYFGQAVRGSWLISELIWPSDRTISGERLKVLMKVPPTNSSGVPRLKIFKCVMRTVGLYGQANDPIQKVVIIFYKEVTLQL